MKYETECTDVATGRVYMRPWTPEEIAAYEAEKNAPPPVPKTITPRQCRLILAQQGLLATIEETIKGMDEATRITWEYALEFRRDDPLLASLGKSLGLTDEQIDAFFIAAAQL